MSPSFDGAHGFISLILNTLRLAVQIDRRRPVIAPRSKLRSARPQSSQALVGPPGDKHLSVFACQSLVAELHGGGMKCLGEFSDDEVPDDDALVPDVAYHDPATRGRLFEYPLYRLQRWEISLLYSPAFRTHLRRLRKQAERMARKLDEFKLCDQARTDISLSGTGSRPVPFFSPQRVKPPASLDNQEIKKKQLQINVDLLLGNNRRVAKPSVASTMPSLVSFATDGSAIPSSSSSLPAAAAALAISAVGTEAGKSTCRPVDEVGVDFDSLFARMLGFTEDLVELPMCVAHDQAGNVATNDIGKYAGSVDTAGFGKNSLGGGSSDEGKGSLRERRGCGSNTTTIRKQCASSSGSGGGHNNSKSGSLRRKKPKAVTSTTTS
ncbi:hypothetical protein EV174_006090, partial [Coemansia sp. RSA 2320]